MHLLDSPASSSAALAALPVYPLVYHVAALQTLKSKPHPLPYRIVRRVVTETWMQSLCGGCKLSCISRTREKMEGDLGLVTSCPKSARHAFMTAATEGSQSLGNLISAT